MAGDKMTDTQKTEQILALLQERHPAPEWATFAELRSSTGAFAVRSMDLWAMNLWPSKNFLRIAYEIKVSRADFAKELSDPRKREYPESVSNECYFATPPGLVMVDEVPEGWGLIEVVKGGTRVKKRAMQRTPDHMPIGFVAAIARRTSDDHPRFPSLTWSYAGREMTKEQLIEVATVALNRSVSYEREAAVETFKQSEKYKKLELIVRVIQRRFGYRCGDPDYLAEFLDGINPSDRPATLPKDVVGSLREANRSIGLAQASIQRLLVLTNRQED